ncbi:MAG: hypothetical protein ACF8GE_09305 [Phycisphaerales bacterium JB043]
MRRFVLLLILLLGGCRGASVERMPGWYTAPRASLEDSVTWVSVGSGATLEVARERAMAALAQRFEAQVRVRELSILRGGRESSQEALVRDVRVNSDVLVHGARVAEVWRSSRRAQVLVLMELDLDVMSGRLRRSLDEELRRLESLIEGVRGEGLSPLERVQRMERARVAIVVAWEHVVLLDAMGREVDDEALRARQARVAALLEEAHDGLRVQVRVRDAERTRASEAFEEIAARVFRTALPTERVHALLTFESSVRPMDIEAHPSGVWSSIVQWEMRVTMVDVMTGARTGVWRRDGVAFGSSEVSVRRDAHARMESDVRRGLGASLTGMLGEDAEFRRSGEQE